MVYPSEDFEDESMRILTQGVESEIACRVFELYELYQAARYASRFVSRTEENEKAFKAVNDNTIIAINSAKEIIAQSINSGEQLEEIPSVLEWELRDAEKASEAYISLRPDYPNANLQ